MALTKKMLQAMGLEDAKIEQIIEAHRDTINGLTDERDNLKAELDKQKADVEKLKSVEKELVKAQAKAEELEEAQKKYKDLKAEFEDFKADVNAKTVLADKQKAYRELLKEAGGSDKRFDSIIKLTDFEKFELDADGKPKDKKTYLDNIKEEWADFIVKVEKKGADVNTPPDNNGGSTFEKMSLAEKMAYANENPDSDEVKAWLK